MRSICRLVPKTLRVPAVPETGRAEPDRSLGEAVSHLSRRAIADFLAPCDALTATGLAANPEPVGRKRDTIEAAGYNLAASLTKLRPEATRFINDLSVPFTNNEGERSIRMAKLSRR